jgi:PAS domain-containing protein
MAVCHFSGFDRVKLRKGTAMRTGLTNVVPVSGMGTPGHDEQVSEEVLGGDAGALLAGADVGLAMYDKDLRLVACNERYRTLRGHSPEEVVAGTLLTELLRRGLERVDVPLEDTEARISTVAASLVPGSSETTRYVGSNA